MNIVHNTSWIQLIAHQHGTLLSSVHPQINKWIKTVGYRVTIKWFHIALTPTRKSLSPDSPTGTVPTCHCFQQTTSRYRLPINLDYCWLAITFINSLTPTLISYTVSPPLVDAHPLLPCLTFEFSGLKWRFLLDLLSRNRNR